MEKFLHPGKHLRILIADDHEIVRRGVNVFLQHHLKCEVCLEVEDGRAAVKLAEEVHPDIAILDSMLPGLGGADLVREIKRVSPQTEIAVLTGSSSPDLLKASFEAGAKSFISKTETTNHLVEAILTLAQHQFFITPEAHLVLHGPDAKLLPSAKKESISHREREVLQLLAEGKSNKEVATLLGISVKTAETHRAAILKKLKLPSLSHLVRYAIRNKMVSA